MIFKIENEEFKTSVNIAARAAAIGKLALFEEMKGILISCDKDSDSMSMRCCNNLKGIKVAVPAVTSVIESGSALVEAKRLADMLGSIPPSTVLSVAARNGKLTLSWGKSSISLPTYTNLDALPSIHTDQTAEAVFEVGQQELSDIISMTSFALADNNTRPVYSGMLLSKKGGTVSAVGCDGYRMAMAEFAVAEEGDASCIIPGNCLGDISRMCADCGLEPVKISIYKSSLKFEVGDSVLTCSRITGDYINPEKPFSAKTNCDITCNVADLKSVLIRFRLADNNLTGKDAAAAVFNFRDDGEIKVSAAAGDNFADYVDFEGKGNNLVAGFNPAYVLDLLKAFPGEKMIMHLGETPTTPLIVERPVKDAENEIKFKSLVLPVRIRA